MVEAVLNLDERTKRILNIVKEQYNLKDQSEAINLIASQYEEEILEPEYSPEFIKETLEIVNGKHIGPFNNAEELKAYIKSLPDEDDEWALYKLIISDKLSKELGKLEKKNIVQFDAIFKKAEEIRIAPNRYKNLNYPLNNLKRVHIDKHFVLLFSVDENAKTITLERFEHHKDAY
jgi:YafQ family addiction module toxin component